MISKGLRKVGILCRGCADRLLTSRIGRVGARTEQGGGTDRGPSPNSHLLLIRWRFGMAREGARILEDLFDSCGGAVDEAMAADTFRAMSSKKEI